MAALEREQVEIKDEENDRLRLQLQELHKKLVQQAEDHKVSNYNIDELEYFAMYYYSCLHCTILVTRLLCAYKHTIEVPTVIAFCVMCHIDGWTCAESV